MATPNSEEPTAEEDPAVKKALEDLFADPEFDTEVNEKIALMYTCCRCGRTYSDRAEAQPIGENLMCPQCAKIVADAERLRMDELLRQMQEHPSRFAKRILELEDTVAKLKMQIGEAFFRC